MSRQCPWVQCPHGQRTRLLISNSILWNFPHCTWGHRTTYNLYESGQLTFYSSFTAQHRMHFKDLQSQRCLLLYYINSYVAIFYCWWRPNTELKRGWISDSFIYSFWSPGKYDNIVPSLQNVCKRNLNKPFLLFTYFTNCHVSTVITVVLKGISGKVNLVSSDSGCRYAITCSPLTHLAG